MVGPPVGYTPLVAGVDHHTRSGRYKEAGPEDLHIFWCPCGLMEGPQKPGVCCAPCTQVPQEGYVSPGQPILPRCLAEVPADDPGLHAGASILGGGSQSASTQWVSPFGHECKGVNVAPKKTHHIHQTWCLQRLRECLIWIHGRRHPA